MSAQNKTPGLDGGRAKSNANTRNNCTSAYLSRKGITLAELQAFANTRIEMRGPVLYRELVNTAGLHNGFERIWPNGAKKATHGATVRGSFTPFGFCWRDWYSLQGELFVCAGLADGYRIHTATGAPVACGVGENNLKSITDPLFTCFPHVRLTVAADNDEAGIRAAKATGCRWIVPGEVSDVA